MKHRDRSREEQTALDTALDVPRHLRGWHVAEFEHFRGQKKARRLAAWAAASGGPAVTAFPLDAARPPAMIWDRTTGRDRRWRAPGVNPAPVVSLPDRRNRAA